LETQAVSRLQWQLRVWARTLGWPGIAGLLLIVATAGFYFAGIRAGYGQLERLQHEAESFKTLTINNVGAPQPPARDHGAWLERFYSLLPARDTAPEALRTLFAAAQEQSLSVDQAEYKTKVEKQGRLTAYEIGLPLRGSYVQIRRFIGEVLERMPAMSLDELVVKRESTTDSGVTASIRFTLYLNGR
jgi:Tfp pilus assembly protein PilO